MTVPSTTAIDPYDYTLHVLRTDPAWPAITPASVATTAEAGHEAALSGTFAGTAAVIDGIWSQFAIDPHAVAVMVGVRTGLAQFATVRECRTWAAVTPSLVADFISSGDPMDDTRRLRKNTLHAAYLALTDAGLMRQAYPTTGIDPVPRRDRHDERGEGSRRSKPATRRPRYADRVHVRPAAHDEVLTIRLATRLARTTRSTHLCAAAVAVATASATSGEAAQVRWEHVNLGPLPTVRLPGRSSEAGYDEMVIIPRIAALDPWEAAVLADRRSEVDTPSWPLSDRSAVLYDGREALTSECAQVCVDQQIGNALKAADLRRETGFAAGSLRLWAAARLVTGWETLPDGAHVAGVDPFALHRQVNQLGERGRCSHT